MTACGLRVDVASTEFIPTLAQHPNLIKMVVDSLRRFIKLGTDREIGANTLARGERGGHDSDTDFDSDVAADEADQATWAGCRLLGRITGACGGVRTCVHHHPTFVHVHVAAPHGMPRRTCRRYALAEQSVGRNVVAEGFGFDTLAECARGFDDGTGDCAADALHNIVYANDGMCGAQPQPRDWG